MLNSKSMKIRKLAICVFLGVCLHLGMMFFLAIETTPKATESGRILYGGFVLFDFLLIFISGFTILAFRKDK